MLCIECAVRQRRADDWPEHTDHDTGLATYYYAFGSDRSTDQEGGFSGEGGAFGGGGAAGSWAAADGVYAFRDQFYDDAGHDPNAFTPTDFAAFDAAMQNDFDDDATSADFFDS